MDTICELQNKLNEVITLMPLMSPPKKQEAVLLWNNAATKIEHIVNSDTDSTDQNSQLYCHQEAWSAVKDDSSVILSGSIEEWDDNSNNQTMSKAAEFGSINDIIPLNSAADNHFEVGDILDDPLFNLTSELSEDIIQTQQNVITENILMQSVPESYRLSSDNDYNSLTHLGGNTASSNSSVIVDPMCSSSSSTPISSSRTDILSRHLINPAGQSNFYSSSSTSNQSLSNNTTIENSHVINNIHNSNSLAQSCLDRDDPALENMLCSDTCDIANQGQFARDSDVAADQTQLGASSNPAGNTSAITSCLNTDAREMGPLQKLLMYKPPEVTMNVSMDNEDPGGNPFDDRTVEQQDQPSLETTAFDASNFPSQNEDHLLCLEQSLGAQANNHSMSRKQFNNNSHSCDVCGKTGFSTKGNLKRHQKAHLGEKPFSCCFCSQKFTENKGLKIHLRKHSGERPFQCETCHKQFTQAHMLKDHMTIHSDERKFPCSRCGKLFRQNSQLKLHYMRHDGIKKLGCTICPRKFITKGDLERHTRTHTGERPYSCNLCEKTFTRQQSLNEHVNRHTGKKPYLCPHCGKDFSEMSACYKHIKMHNEDV